jgi:UDP-N-acetylglucosamine diphosphorylase / glucose-1-phosphate thymidylyltransferase / UDP-N-acetylgalactosamine diphosphorylase / glucosamine-1-phosphate N-acetyltransferase / galactosamine-1-phosphate N-acetyltransferase
MKAVILVAGKGTRMAKHHEGPKQLLMVGDKPIIQHTLDALPPEIDGLVFVVGGPHEKSIRNYFKQGQYHGLPIEFVVQEEQLGLAHAFKTAQSLLSGKWMGMVGDDIFDPAGLAELPKYELSILASHTDHPENFGILVTDSAGYLSKAVEKPKEFVSNLANAGAMVMDDRFFAVEVSPSARGEYEVPDVWQKMISEQGAKIKVVESDFWFPINEASELAIAAKKLAELE